MDEAVIRRATAADAAGLAAVHTAGLAAVHTASWREAYADLLPADFLARRVVPESRWVGSLWVGDDRPTFVAAIGARVVGFASVAESEGEPGVGQLYALYLLAAYWGQGLGHRLHRRGMGWLVERGFTEAVLVVLTDNHRTVAFYRRQGWVDDGPAVPDVIGGRTVRVSPMRRRLGDAQR